MSTRAVIGVIHGFASALGVRCTHCHVGDDPSDLSTINFVRAEAGTATFDVFGPSGYLGEVTTPGEILERGVSFAMEGSLMAATFIGIQGEHEVRIFEVVSTSTAPGVS